MDKVILDVDVVSIDRGTDGSLILFITPSGNGPSTMIQLKRGDPSAEHPVILAGRGVEVAWIRGLLEGEDDDDPRCDVGTSVVRDEDDGVLRSRTDNEGYVEIWEARSHVGFGPR